MWANIRLSVGTLHCLPMSRATGVLAQRDRHVEEAPVGPVVIVVEIADQRDGSCASSLLEDGDGVALLHRLSLGRP